MKKLIPFNLMPGAWGLKGKTRQIAEAEYYFEGFELEMRLLEINKDEHTSEIYNRKVYDLQRKHNKIDDMTYYRSLADLISDETQRNIAILELDFREGKVKQIDYDKKLATLKGEPWVTVVNMDFSKGNSLQGSFEIDWNEYFVKKLEAEGYVGPTPDNIVNQWFMEVCKNIALEEFDGLGDFTPDSEANLEAVKAWSQEKANPAGRKSYK
jgi:hypothetical protein